jgi:hypothetical protein
MPTTASRVGVRVRFLPFDCPEYADSDGWLRHEFRDACEAWEWAAGNISFVEDAYFANETERFDGRPNLICSGALQDRD